MLVLRHKASREDALITDNQGPIEFCLPASVKRTSPLFAPLSNSHGYIPHPAVKVEQAVRLGPHGLPLRHLP